MRCAGRGGTVEGFRADRIVGDDIIDESAIYSQADREETVRWLDNTVLLRLEPGGHIAFWGSPWALDDAYVWLARDRKFDRWAYPARNPDGTPAFPHRLSDDFLRDKEATDPATYALKYRLDRSEQPGGYRWKWVEDGFFTLDGPAPTDPKRGALTYYIGVDPALKAGGDYFAIAVIGVDHVGIMYLVDLYLARGRLAPEQVDDIADKWRKWGAVWVGNEDVAYQDALRQHVQQKYPACPMVGVKLPAMNKEVKLQSLAPLFQGARLRVARDLPEMEAFREQYLSYPKGAHDDVLDATWIAIQGTTRDSQVYVGSW